MIEKLCDFCRTPRDESHNDEACLQVVRAIADMNNLRRVEKETIRNIYDADGTLVGTVTKVFLTFEELKRMYPDKDFNGLLEEHGCPRLPVTE